MSKKRKKTELGRTLAKIRIDFDETGADMAKKLGISSSQMFNIEVGLANVGYEFIGKVQTVYGLDLTDVIQRGGGMSKITFDLDDLSANDKKTVLGIWASNLEGNPLKLKDTVTVDELTITIPRDDGEAPIVATVADTTEARKKRGRPRTMRAAGDIGFLSEEDASELEGIVKEDVL